MTLYNSYQEKIMPYPKIMIVEDDTTSARMLKQMLEKYGYAITDPIATGEEAIEQTQLQKPDLILMDIKLAGEKDGIETADIIFKEFNIPFLYITSSTDDKTINRAKKTNPYGYIIKPYDKNMLYAAIEMALFKYDTEKKLQESEQRNRDILSTIPDIMFNLNRDGSFTDSAEEDIASRVWNSRIREKAVSLIEKSISLKKPQILEYSLKKGESVSHMEARIINSTDDKALVVVRNVTEKKNAEIELENHRENLEKLVEERTSEIKKINSSLISEIEIRKKIEINLKVFNYAIDQNPNVVVIVNNLGQVEYVNSKFESVSGFSADEVVATSVTSPGNKIIPEPDTWKNITGTQNWKGEIYGLTSDNNLYYLNATVSSLKNENDETTHYIISGEDITQKKRDNINIEKINKTVERSKVDMLDRDLDWKEWKDKMMSRNISRTDKSLFRNINNSFTQGAGFGTLITLLEMMASAAEKQNGKYLVDSGLFDLIQNNLQIAQDAFKTFSNIDWIISNEFEMETININDFYEYTRAVTKKAENLTSLKNQRIIISENNLKNLDITLSINKEHYFKSVYEALLNAMKFSRKNSVIALIIHLYNKNVLVSVISDPEKSDEGFIGIPSEYEKVVFEPFYRLTKHVYEQYSTLDFGLGLTLIDKIVTKHGGEVFINNIMDHSDLKKEPQSKVNLTIALPFSEEMKELS